MSGVNQMTLFQTWGASVPQKVSQAKHLKTSAGRRKTTPNSSNTAPAVKTSKPGNGTLTDPASRNSLWGEFGQGSIANVRDLEATADGDDDDDLMVVAVYEAERSLQIDGNFGKHTSLIESTTTTTSNSITQTSSSGTTNYNDFPGLDSSSAKIWIYPTNYPIRNYQLKISEAALFQNTLVCLPTGLGKTFIAAVVMYNFYRWYPSGKIVFMAPTKPLVAQQIEACYNVMGIPQGHMAELTGSTQAAQRQVLWRSRRIFFLTPQVLVNDLSRDACPALQVKCVVIDEAHKALGNHAYCQVVRQLGSQTQQFRILALSATPGGDTKSVQQVISNLLISHIELRSEESPDIQAHSHQRSLEKVVVPLGESLARHQALYLQVLERFTGRLIQNRAMSHRDLRSLTKYQLILAREQFRKNPPGHLTAAQLGALEGDFALCISLYHGYELLLQMGLRSLFQFVRGIMNGDKEMSRARSELQRNATFMNLYLEMETTFEKPKGPSEPFVYSHPKLQKLEEVVVGHFRTWSENAGSGPRPQEVSTRVMIFSSFRESVQEIAAMLNRHLPLIKVMSFMGQASAGKGVKGFTQKEQLEVVRSFREGGFNTLVSTCVGEEGLDIGEVDLIVCFDAQKSPIRLVQRMGRTGRKRRGRIVVILAEGREERTYNQSQSNKRSVYRSIVGNSHSFKMYPLSPRMLPDEVRPALHRMHITCGRYAPQESGGERCVAGRRSHSSERRGRVDESEKDDGFLSPSEHAHWEATMKLTEDEPRPTLRRSRFLSLQEASPPPEGPLSTGPTRELSLWEWRHWQNQPFPIHRVDHSSRCHHFTQVMGLIDGMCQEEGESKYELELLPHLNQADVVDTVEAQQEKPAKGKKRRVGKTRTASLSDKPKTSCHSSAYIDRVEFHEDVQRESVSQKDTTLASPWTLMNNIVPSECHTVVTCDLRENQRPEGLWPLLSSGEKPIVDMDLDMPPHDESGRSEVQSPTEEEQCPVSKPARCRDAAEQTHLNPLSSTAELGPGSEEDSELESLFYLPKWDAAARTLQPLRRSAEGIRAILANVTELLSRSPPSLHFDLDRSVYDFGPGAATSTTIKERSLTLSPGSPREPLEKPLDEPQTFKVNFSLEVEEDSADPSSQTANVDLKLVFPDGRTHPVPQEPTPRQCSPVSLLALQAPADCSAGSGGAVRSPSWDEVFEDDVSDGDKMRADDDVDNADDFEWPCPAAHPQASLDESLDLFEDDEAFLQVTIPDGRTPENIGIRSPSPRKTTGSNESVTETNMLDPNHLSPVVQRESSPELKESFDCSQDFFSINFDLGWEEDEEAGPAAGPGGPSPPSSKKQETPHSSQATAFNDISSSTPSFSFRKIVSTPAGPRVRRADTSALTSPLTSKNGALFSPIPTSGLRRTLLPGPPATSSPFSAVLKGKRQEALQEAQTPRDEFRDPGLCTSDTEEEVVNRQQSHPTSKAKPSSPESVFLSDGDSPVQVTRKPKLAVALISDESEGEAMSDNDFQNSSVHRPRRARPVAATPPPSRKRARHALRRHNSGARHFLDEEAELSDEEGEASSDEEDGEEQNRSLEGFVVNNTLCSQGLNDSEMRGVYLKSVRSPAVTRNFKMVYKQNHNMDIFSQVPEQDETYGEDSFVVYGSEEELSAEEEEEVTMEPLREDSFVDGRRQYQTRRRALLRDIRAQTGTRTGRNAVDKRHAADSNPKPVGKTKRLRIVRLAGSSSEEEGAEESGERPKTEVVAALCRPAEVQQQNDRVFRAPQQQAHQNVLRNGAPRMSSVMGPGAPSGACRASSASSVMGPGAPSGACRASSASSVMGPGAPSGACRASSASCVKGSREEQREERCRQRLHQQALLSEELDFEPSESLLSPREHPQATSSSLVPQAQSSVVQVAAACKPPASSPGLVSVLVDSRCITACVDVVSSLRQRHAVTAHVCSLDGCDFVVSNRMAVERQNQSELAGSQNRKRLVERVTNLQGLFERICLIIEKDRTKPGEVSRPSQRTRYYDSTLASLVRAGVRLLVSGGPEESAALLAELARLEQRKGQAISVPLEVKGHRQQALAFYRTLPCVSYVSALNMAQSFRSVSHLVNSSVEALQKGACVSHPRAEEIYRSLRYSCDTTLMNTSTARKNDI
ncbi:Fanconi anemia group M protein [Esox lucius]|uniref:FA complementation group M n=1 Tax=Esox lucius TaxID=8010 RepID=A0A3P8YGX6_ESOLU|nr:Fanconi anemia group M protein [Esox lucius]